MHEWNYAPASRLSESVSTEHRGAPATLSFSLSIHPSISILIFLSAARSRRTQEHAVIRALTIGEFGSASAQVW